MKHKFEKKDIPENEPHMPKYFTDDEIFLIVKKIVDGTFKMSQIEIEEKEKFEKEKERAVFIREKLSKLHTKQLLQLLRRSYMDDEYPQSFLYEELAKHPHIKNKKESRLFRQENAKKFKGSRNKNK